MPSSELSKSSSKRYGSFLPRVRRLLGRTSSPNSSSLCSLSSSLASSSSDSFGFFLAVFPLNARSPSGFFFRAALTSLPFDAGFLDFRLPHDLSLSVLSSHRSSLSTSSSTSELPSKSLKSDSTFFFFFFTNGLLSSSSNDESSIKSASYRFLRSRPDRLVDTPRSNRMK